MHKLSRILAAVDFSNPGRSAFEQALALSHAHGAELMVVHAVPEDRPFRWRARGRIALIATLRQIAESRGVRFSAGVQHGDPSGVILLHARSSRPDLIVLGTHQRTGLDRLRAGSVAERVVSQAAQPVLVVPARAATDARSFDSIVVAVDFRDASRDAVEQALVLAGVSAGRITLVHVVPGSPDGVPRELYRYGLTEYQNRLALDAWRRLQSVIPPAAAAAAQVRARVVIGDVPTEIARVADETGADAIVVGVTRRGPISRKLFAATAARVMRTAGRPVVAVPEGRPPARAHVGADAGAIAA
jgi:nucleotide-binding universal stress UspA family protein